MQISKQYEPQIGAFKDKYHLIIPDLRGNGASSELDLPVNEVIQTQTRDVYGLLKYLNVDNCFICGVSYGGLVSYRYTLDYPEMVRGLIICDSFSDSIPKNLMEKLNMALIKISLPLYRRREFLSKTLGLAYNKYPLAKEYFLKDFKNMRSEEVIIQRKALNEVNYTEELNKIECPVLGLVGDGAQILIKSMKGSMEAIKDSKLHILKDSIDPSNLCSVEEFNNAIDNFIDSYISK